MNKTVLVTGGLGFIGSHVCLELLSLGHNVIVVDNLSNASANVVDSLYQITGQKLIYHQMDLCNPELEQVFREHHIDCVIHLAGLKSVGESIKFPIRYYDTNLNATLNLLKCMEKFNCFNLIFSSSATVYGTSPAPLTEESSTGTGISNPYGETKFVIEKMLMSVARSNPNWMIVSLRYFNPVGAHESGLLGENPNDVPNNLMPYIMRVAQQNNTDLKLGDSYNQLTIFGNDYGTPDGTCIRDFIHVVDLAKAHLVAMQYIGIERESNYYCFNIGTGNGTSVMELVRTFSDVNQCEVPFVFGERRPGDLVVVYCNNQKAIDELGWTPAKTVEDMCRDSWNFQKNLLKK